MKIFNVEYLITEHENGSKRGTRYKDNLNVVARDAIDAGRKVEEKLLNSTKGRQSWQTELMLGTASDVWW